MVMPMMQKVPRRKDEFIWREIDGETFILSEAGDKIITLNKVASFIWQKCDGRRSLGQIRDEILKKFKVNMEVAQQDLDRFVAEMKIHEMIIFS
jgi:hypothetical protein